MSKAIETMSPYRPKTPREFYERMMEWQDATRDLRGAITQFYLSHHPLGFFVLRDGSISRDEYKFTEAQQEYLDALKRHLEQSKYDFGLIADKPMGELRDEIGTLPHKITRL